jgi:hypothetical protein
MDREQNKQSVKCRCGEPNGISILILIYSIIQSGIVYLLYLSFQESC